MLTSVDMRRLLNLQFVRFVLVGIMNTGFSYAVYAALLYLGLGFVVANLGAMLLGVLFSFRTQGRLVFGNRDERRIFRFAGCWAGIWVVNILLIAGFVKLDFNDYAAGALALVPVTLASYFIQKRIVFNIQPGASTAKPAG